jgi:hypothetical protein
MKSSQNAQKAIYPEHGMNVYAGIRKKYLKLTVVRKSNKITAQED